MFRMDERTNAGARLLRGLEEAESTMRSLVAWGLLLGAYQETQCQKAPNHAPVSSKLYFWKHKHKKRKLWQTKKKASPRMWTFPVSRVDYGENDGNNRHQRRLEEGRGMDLRHLSRYELHRRLALEEDLFQADDLWGVDLEMLRNSTHAHHRYLKALKSSTASFAPSDSTTTTATDNYQAVPLSQGYGTHYANLWIGSPTPQRKTLIVDTGSHYTAFPCTGCENCGASHHTDPYFDPTLSETFHAFQCDECQNHVTCQAEQCPFSQGYTEGSTWDAIQVSDIVYCGGSDYLEATDTQHSIRFMFGCQTRMSGLFVTQLADGIIGMSAHSATLPKQLYDAGRMEHNLFALCFRRELGTSKRGVHAGSMTLGGVSTALDNGPVVYAKNWARSGWYTIRVQNIFVQRSHKIVRVPVDRTAINSGKGVIVDSGTTDTYLNKQVAREFGKAWRQVTGKSYSHSPLSLTREQVQELPTILIQAVASDSRRWNDVYYDSVPGYTGSLDPLAPHDPLIAIPASSYMDYSPVTKMYSSRLYFSETAGSVLGSNTLQGHNVVFDWENGRVGFAESSCAYDKKDVPKAALDDGYATDCVLSAPMISTPCHETVQTELCRHNPNNIAVLGTETWTSIVESPGTVIGLSCQVAAATMSKENNPREKPVIRCNGRGICEEERPCQLTCTELQDSLSAGPLPDSKQPNFNCGDSFWSACDVNCTQTRIQSVAHVDGFCHETHREERPCHVGACARLEFCMVPYVVHTVINVRGGDVSRWTNQDSELFQEVMATSLSHDSSGDEYSFQSGDVHVLSVLPWYEDELDMDRRASQGEPDIIGFRIAAEISVWQDEKSCSPESMLRAANAALHMRKDILHQSFPYKFVSAISDSVDSGEDTTAFRVWMERDVNPEGDVLVIVWTIRTDVDDNINYFGPQRPFMATLYAIVHNATMLSTGILGLMLLWSAWVTWRDYFQARFSRIFRRFAYKPVQSEDDSEVEDRVLRGSMHIGRIMKLRNRA